jgi:hypothetical protein
MITLPLEQGTPEWLEYRRQLGGPRRISKCDMRPTFVQA